MLLTRLPRLLAVALGAGALGFIPPTVFGQNALQKAKADRLSEEAKGLQGEWRVVRCESEGEALSKEKIEAMSVEIKGDRLTFITGTEKRPSGFTLRGDGKVKEIDLQPEGKRPVIRGIYKVEEKQLWLCFDSDPKQKDRPKEFSTAPKTSLKVFVLERKSP
jgi:uncharacterized protein (TIGR03067 family)